MHLLSEGAVAVGSGPVPAPVVVRKDFEVDLAALVVGAYEAVELLVPQSSFPSCLIAK